MIEVNKIIDIAEAYTLCKRAHPGMVIYAATEYSKVYAFRILTKKQYEEEYNHPNFFNFDTTIVRKDTG